MKARGLLPEIPRGALRDVATDARIDRVWRRLEGDLQGGSVEGPRAVRRLDRPLTGWVLALSGTAALCFAGGWLVGHGQQDGPMPTVTFTNERAAAGEAATGPAAPASPSAERARGSERPVVRGRRTPRGRQLLEPPTEQQPVLSVLPAVVPAPAASGPPEWHVLWTADEYQGAREAIEREGGFDAVLEGATAEQAMAMVDIARFAHENALAIAALRRVVERFPTDPNAPFAALTLGNLLDRAGDAKGAAAAFSAYRSLSPDGDFAEDALARQFEAALREGDLTRARELFAQYEKQYPAGSRLESLRAELGAAAAPGEFDPAGPAGDLGRAVETSRVAEPGGTPRAVGPAVPGQPATSGSAPGL